MSAYPSISLPGRAGAVPQNGCGDELREGGRQPDVGGGPRVTVGGIVGEGCGRGIDVHRFEFEAR